MQIGEDGVISLGQWWPAMEEREKEGINGDILEEKIFMEGKIFMEFGGRKKKEGKKGKGKRICKREIFSLT